MLRLPLGYCQNSSRFSYWMASPSVECLCTRRIVEQLRPQGKRGAAPQNSLLSFPEFIHYVLHRCTYKLYRVNFGKLVSWYLVKLISNIRHWFPCILCAPFVTLKGPPHWFWNGLDWRALVELHIPNRGISGVHNVFANLELRLKPSSVVIICSWIQI